LINRKSKKFTELFDVGDTTSLTQQNPEAGTRRDETLTNHTPRKRINSKHKNKSHPKKADKFKA
jgi:hypothetical protein